MLENAPPALFNTKRAEAFLSRAQKFLQVDAIVQEEIEASLLDRLGEFSKFQPKRIAVLGLYTAALLKGLDSLYPESYLALPTLSLESPLVNGADPPPPYDLILHVNALHHVNDLPGVFVQCQRALSKNGLFLASLFGENTLREFEAFILSTEEQLLGSVSPRTMPKVDLKTLAQLLGRAGFKDPVTDTLNFQLEYEALTDLIWDIRRLGLSSSLALPTNPMPRTLAIKLHEAFPTYATVTFDAVCLTARKP